MTTQQVTKKYGTANVTGSGYLVKIKLPYPMRIAWDLDSSVNSMMCHKLVADNFTAVFNELLSVYGYDKIKELGIDLFGGCFNYRKMRGGNALSMHSWGIAIDISPLANGLKTPFNKALFSKPEYAKMHEIFEKNGFINLGKTKGYDAMHWEISK
jgi:hypothetical protein